MWTEIFVFIISLIFEMIAVKLAVGWILKEKIEWKEAVYIMIAIWVVKIVIILILGAVLAGSILAFSSVLA